MTQPPGSSGMPGGDRRLSLAELHRVPAAFRPAIDPRQRRVRIVHLGIGAFHRAHQAAYTEECGDWGSCGVTQRSPRVVEQLAPQDSLYTLLVRDGTDARPQVIGAVREVIYAGADPAAVTARMADPGVSIVSLTVSEKGYRHDPATGRLHLQDPEIAADLAGRPPRTVIGQLTAGLAARAAAGAGAITVLCCDNLPANGPTLRGFVLTYAEAYAAAARRCRAAARLDRRAGRVPGHDGGPDRARRLRRRPGGRGGAARRARSGRGGG